MTQSAPPKVLGPLKGRTKFCRTVGNTGSVLAFLLYHHRRSIQRNRLLDTNQSALYGVDIDLQHYFQSGSFYKYEALQKCDILECAIETVPEK